MMAVRDLHKDLAEKAKQELNENPDSIHEDIRIITEWLTLQPHLKSRNDDQWLLSFLRGCKFSLERAKQKLDFYYTVRSLSPELCRINPDDSNFRHVFDAGYALPLHTLDMNGARLCIINTGVFDGNKFSIYETAKVLIALYEMILMEDDDAVVSGITYICDLEGFNMAYAAQLTPPYIKKVVSVLVDSVPLRLKSVHILNPPTFFEPIFKVFKSMLSEKQNSKLMVHGKNLEEFHKQVPKERLPIEYGGLATSIEESKKYWVNKMDSEYRDWFSKDADFGTDESKRPGTPKTADSIFGMAGSFKQLNVD